MIITPCGFRVMRGSDNERRIVDYSRVFHAYCHADPAAHPEIPAYLSAFTFPSEFRQHLEKTGSTADYHGSVGIPSIKWDVDRDGNLDVALRDTRKLSSFLVDRFRLDVDELLIGFSGSKGFHVELLVDWPEAASSHANVTTRRFCEQVVSEINITIDTNVYDKVRLFRAWNTRHPKTGLYKVRVGLDVLLVSNIEFIMKLAVEPIPFDPPTPSSAPSLQAAWTGRRTRCLSPPGRGGRNDGPDRRTPA